MRLFSRTTEKNNSAQVAYNKLKSDIQHSGRFAAKQNKSMYEALMDVITEHTGINQYSASMNFKPFDNNPDLSLLNINIVFPKQEASKVKAVLH
ncbi:MAG: hypothetical protein HQL46_13070 [Gammaproteobacteria bacterium]|nr:hypothetical protein [Gammaproteobacteria bacterium]